MGTRTYAVMEVSAAVYDEVRAKLEAAEYKHAIGERGELNMHGIALKWDGRGRLGVTPAGEHVKFDVTDEVAEELPEAGLDAARGMGEHVGTTGTDTAWRDDVEAPMRRLNGFKVGGTD